MAFPLGPLCPIRASHIPESIFSVTRYLNVCNCTEPLDSNSNEINSRCHHSTAMLFLDYLQMEGKSPALNHMPKVIFAITSLLLGVNHDSCWKRSIIKQPLKCGQFAPNYMIFVPVLCCFLKLCTLRQHCLFFGLYASLLGFVCGLFLVLFSKEIVISES